MSYTGPTARNVTLKWADAGQAVQFQKVQAVYKTVPGTRRSETPYQGTTSFLDGESKYGTLSNNYVACNTASNQEVYGRVINDYYALKTRALNRARSRFVTAMKESRESSIGSSLAEMDQSLRMIGDRAKQLYGFAKSLKRGEWRKAATALGIVKPPFKHGWRPESRELGGVWLEYHFGWSPLLGDIHDGMKLISAPLPSDGRVRGRGKALEIQPRIKTYDSGGSYPLRLHLSGTFVAYCELRGMTTLVNPNLDLLQSLGLANPLEVAWELTPFSFLVDHVVGIGDFLSSFSDELGWKIADLATSQLTYCRDGKFWRDANVGHSTQAYGSSYMQAFALNFQRAVNIGGLPPRSLEFVNPFTGLSAPRAATYISLLLQQLK
jgi:hypothetical protein